MILTGIFFGLASAAGGGLANIANTVAGRRIGAVPTMAGTQVTAFMLTAIIGLLAGVTIPFDSSLIPMAAAIAALASVTYLAFLEGLRLGPVSIVSPIVGAYGGAAVVLAVLLFGEVIEGTQAIAVIAAVTGVILASVAFDRGARTARIRGPGPLLAIVAAFGFAANVTGLTYLIRDYGWLPALIVWRGWLALFASLILVVFIARGGRRSEESRPSLRARLDRPILAVILASGALDVLSTAALAIGLEVSFAWLVGLLSSLGPLSGVVWGIALFGERLSRIQLVGVALVALSLVLLALG